MKKLLTCFTLFAYCSLSHAQWMYFGTDDDRVDYINKELQFNGDSVRFWVIQDFKKAQTVDSVKAAFLSQKNMYEIDCAVNQFNIVVLEYYDKHMAQGEKIHFVAESSPNIEIEPDSFGEALREFVCK